MPFKQRPPRNAKERQLLADWEASVERHAKPLERGAVAKAVVVFVETDKPVPTLSKGTREGSDLYRLPSVATEGGAVAGKKDSPQYTGNEMLGVSQMAKSNSVPVFSKEAIIDIARMRR